MDEKTRVPMFVSIVTIILGCYDLFRGIMHTFRLEYSALHIAQINLAGPEASDLLRLLGVFGISNYITGIMLILIGLKARGLALIMLFVIPVCYTIGMLTINANSIHYAVTKAAWGGMMPMIAYLIISGVTFVAGLIGTLYNLQNNDD